ncbi:MAG TPA: hypothetical protein VFG31_08835 [Conexibacter sp.]|nr:hypothetical protein [Conexibacter sp.]
MSDALAWTRGLARPVHARPLLPGVGDGRPTPLVAILCAAPRARAAAAGIALALARALDAPCALAAVVGEQTPGVLVGVPSAHRAVAALRARSLSVAASGRLVWLADRRGPRSVDDVAGRAAAVSAELGRSAMAVGAPAAVAIPFARVAALDRMLAWHDALVAVCEPDAADGVVDCALASLAELGRPVVAMTPPRRSSGLLAVAGLASPSEAEAAVSELALGRAHDDG